LATSPLYDGVKPIRGRLFAWLLLRLKQPQQTCCLVISKTLFNNRWGHVNSRFEREIGEAAPGCFF